MIDACRDLGPDDLEQGLTASFERKVTAEDVDRFADLSWDYNPLHTDEDYAAGTQFAGRVVHGVFHLAMVSALIGMLLPGRRALIAGMNAKFHAPLRIGDTVSVSGTLVSWNRPLRTGRVRVRIVRAGEGALISETAVGVVLHQERVAMAATPAARQATAPRPGEGEVRPTILVTGAAGGLGAALIDDLSADHDIIAVVNRRALAAHVGGEGRVTPVSIDLSADDWEAALDAALADLLTAEGLITDKDRPDLFEALEAEVTGDE